MKASNNLDDRLTHAFRLVMCRKPTDLDLGILRRAYAKQVAIYAKDGAAARALLGRGRVRGGTRRSTPASTPRSRRSAWRS